MSTAVQETRTAPRDFAGQRAIVVGASSGMGARIVDELLAAGVRVAGLDLAHATWPETGGVTPRFAIDVSQPESVDAAFEQATHALGGLDIVVNCAGVLGKVQPSTEVNVDDFSRMLAINLLGAFSVTKSALTRLLPNGYGRIVHIASIAGKEGNPQMAAYSASKAGVIGMVKSMGKEYATSGVTINAIAPASIETPLIAGMTPERQNVQKALIPLGRFGTTDEVAALVAYIASPRASFTTGFVFDVSGGRAVY